MTTLTKRSVAAFLAVGLTAGLLLGATARPATHGSALTPRYKALARAALLSYLHHGDPLARLTGHSAIRPGTVTKAGSYNWSGYAELSKAPGTYTHVTSTWKVPAVTCTKEDQIVAEWIGLDGATDGTVEQDGTTSWCFEGKANYYSWYEMYPAGSVYLGSGSNVKPGDTMYSSIVARPSGSNFSYTLKLTDETHDNADTSLSVTKTCAKTTCLDESAEWIIERPAYDVNNTLQIVPQADYKATQMNDDTFTSGGKTTAITSTSSTWDIEMIDDTKSYALSTPGGLTAGGKSFTDKWDNSF